MSDKERRAAAGASNREEKEKKKERARDASDHEEREASVELGQFEQRRGPAPIKERPGAARDRRVRGRSLRRR